MVVVCGSSCSSCNEAVAGDAAEVLILGEFGFGTAKVHLELAELVLEERDDSDAAVDRVTEAHIGLVGQGIDCVFTLVGVQLVEKFGDIACSEHFVNICELLGLVWWEVRCEHALWLAFSTQELTCSTWGVR